MRLTRKAVEDEEIVQFPVPRRYLAEVIELLARLQHSDRRSRGSPRDNRERPWTKEELKWLRQLLAERPTALELLDITAALAGDSLTFAELCQSTGARPRKARGELASLTSIVRKHFDRDQWPAEAHWERDGFCYRMRPDTAVLWQEVLIGQ